MDRWQVRLEGGPFDGDEATVSFEGKEPDPRIWVTFCEKCGDTHWYYAWHRGGEVYKRHDADFAAMTVKYLYEEIDTSPAVKESERELVNA